MSSCSPIGVFDSGLGGLSVAREIRCRMPGEDMLYVADSAYCPYGGRPLEEISRRSVAVTEELLRRGAKIVVVACNTASGAAIDLLRARFDVPIVGLEPAVKPAAASSELGRIAVLATPATLRTERFHRLVDRHGAGVELVKVPCPGFVELVEQGRVSGPEAVEVIRTVLAPLEDVAVDRVVLGCTHYPFLRAPIAEVLGPDIQILDSGAAVARQVDRVLAEHDLASARCEGGSFQLFTTGNPNLVEPVASNLWDEQLNVEGLSI
jgi:glutamate racemase